VERAITGFLDKRVYMRRSDSGPFKELRSKAAGFDRQRWRVGSWWNCRGLDLVRGLPHGTALARPVSEADWRDGRQGLAGSRGGVDGGVDCGITVVWNVASSACSGGFPRGCVCYCLRHRWVGASSTALIVRRREQRGGVKSAPLFLLVVVSWVPVLASYGLPPAPDPPRRTGDTGRHRAAATR
jgi:hypothetical protein